MCEQQLGEPEVFTQDERRGLGYTGGGKEEIKYGGLLQVFEGLSCERAV